MDTVTVEKSFLHALEADPNDRLAHMAYADFLEETGGSVELTTGLRWAAANDKWPGSRTSDKRSLHYVWVSNSFQHASILPWYLPRDIHVFLKQPADRPPEMLEAAEVITEGWQDQWMKSDGRDLTNRARAQAGHILVERLIFLAEFKLWQEGTVLPHEELRRENNKLRRALRSIRDDASSRDLDIVLADILTTARQALVETEDI